MCIDGLWILIHLCIFNWVENFQLNKLNWIACVAYSLVENFQLRVENLNWLSSTQLNWTPYAAPPKLEAWQAQCRTMHYLALAPYFLFIDSFKEASWCQRGLKKKKWNIEPKQKRRQGYVSTYCGCKAVVNSTEPSPCFL